MRCCYVVGRTANGLACIVDISTRLVRIGCAWRDLLRTARILAAHVYGHRFNYHSTRFYYPLLLVCPGGTSGRVGSSRHKALHDRVQCMRCMNKPYIS